MVKKLAKKKTKELEPKKTIRERIKNHKKNKCNHQCTGFWVFGSALAIVLSYTQNSSILWAIIHGIISWFYVIYRAIIPYF